MARTHVVRIGGSADVILHQLEHAHRLAGAVHSAEQPYQLRVVRLDQGVTPLSATIHCAGLDQYVS
jgi:hypothetical protein